MCRLKVEKKLMLQQIDYQKEVDNALKKSPMPEFKKQRNSINT